MFPRYDDSSTELEGDIRHARDQGMSYEDLRSRSEDAGILTTTPRVEGRPYEPRDFPRHINLDIVA